jgi:hypothetical protein
VKVTANVTVNVLPDPDCDDAPTFTEHWLLDSVPAVPICCADQAVPASFARWSQPPEGTYRWKKHALVPFTELLYSMSTQLMSLQPLVAE